MKPFTMDEFLAHMDPNVNKTFTDMGIQVPDISAQPPIQNSMPQSQPMPKPALAPSEPQASSVQDPLVREHLMKKMYDMGEFTDENRQSLVDQNSGFSLGDKISGALSALGAGFQGRDSGAAMNARMNQIRGQKDAAINQFDKARDQKIQNNKISQDNEKFDPMSSSSMAFKKAIESNFPEIAKAYGEAWNDVSAADQELIFEPLKLKETIDARKMMAQEQRDERRFLSGMKQEERNELRDEKRQDKLDQLSVPGYERTGEVMQRPEEASKFRKATATADALGQKLNRMKQLVKEKGSFEWGGEAGTEMESLATEIQLLGKSPELYELGVLTGPDLSLLQKITADPSSMSSFFTRDSSRNKQIESQLKSIEDKIGTTAKSLGYKKAGGMAPQSSEKDSQALEWAKSNPNDPRAAKILQRLGM